MHIVRKDVLMRTPYMCTLPLDVPDDCIFPSKPHLKLIACLVFAFARTNSIIQFV